MRLCVVFLAVLLTRGLASRPLPTDNENSGRLIDALLAVAENFSTCKTSESVLSVRDALVNQQEVLRDVLTTVDAARETPQQCSSTNDQQRSMEFLMDQLQVVKGRCDATEKLVKTSIDGVREDFVLRLSQEMGTMNAQLLDVRKDNEAWDKSVEKLQSVVTEMDEKVKDLYASISSVQKDLKNTISKGGLGCPSPFMSVNSDCLYIHHHSAMKWAEARSFCRQIGGDLAVPKDVTKLRAFLLKYGHKKDFWVGATDSAVEGVFRWVTGTQVDLLTGWRSGQPDDSHGEDCVHYRAEDMLFNDADCHNTKYFICQAHRLQYPY